MSSLLFKNRKRNVVSCKNILLLLLLGNKTENIDMLASRQARATQSVEHHKKDCFSFENKCLVSDLCINV